MKKKLLALAVAGALVAPVAMADTANVTIYGHANVSVDSVNDGLVAGSTRSTQVSDNVSYLGLKGSEDLGGGTSAIWQLESAVSLDGTGNAPCTVLPCAAPSRNTLGTRNSFAGLSGESWGTVLLGRHDSPYKLATRGLDLFADTIADNRSLMGQTGGGATSHDVRATDVIAYISPAMSGFTVAVAYVAGAELATAAATKGSAWSLAGMYGAGPISASLAYQVVDAGTALTNPAQPIPFNAAGLSKATAWKLGGGYSMDAFAVNAAYEHTTSSIIAGGDILAQNNWYVAGKFNVSASDAVKLVYTHAGTNPQGAGTASVANSDAKQWSLGYDHNLSKRTTVYALYTKLSNNTAAAYGLGGITTGGTAATTADADPSAISLGLKHTF